MPRCQHVPPRPGTPVAGRDLRIAFAAGQAAAVVTAMEELAATGRGWVNLRPDVDPSEVPDPPSAPALVQWLFTNPAPPLPVGTWTAPPKRRGTSGVATVGLAHPCNARVARRLADAGSAIPAGWHMVQDNARRGLVLRVAPDTGPGAALGWLLRAMAALSPVDCAGRFTAEVHP